jgi:hypothetical protein
MAYPDIDGIAEHLRSLGLDEVRTQIAGHGVVESCAAADRAAG